METKTYTAKSDDEARGFHDGTVTEIIIPCEPKIEVQNGFVYGGNCAGSVDYLMREPHHFFDPCPYTPGDEIGVKEGIAVRVDVESNTEKVKHYLLYMRDKPDLEMQFHPYRRISPSKMPLWAIDIRLICQSTQPQQREGTWVWVCKVTRKA